MNLIEENERLFYDLRSNICRYSVINISLLICMLHIFDYALDTGHFYLQKFTAQHYECCTGVQTFLSVVIIIICK